MPKCTYLIGNLVVLEQNLEGLRRQRLLHDAEELALLRADHGGIGQVDDRLLEVAHLHQVVAELDLGEEVRLHLAGVLEDGNIKQLAALLRGLLVGVAFCVVGEKEK